MIRIFLKDPLSEESATQIVWHNLTEADKYFDLKFFIASATAWIKLNPDKNYQDLEKELRERNLNTHLYATQKPSEMKHFKLGLFKQNDHNSYIYECIFSCRPKDLALKEVLSHWPSYEENFDKLKVSGSLFADNVNKDPNLEIFNSEEKNNYEQITNNKKKIIFEKVSPDKYLNEMVEMCRKEFGKEPVEKIVGMNKEGGVPIFALFLDEKLVSDIGFFVELDEKGNKIMKLFNLKNLFPK